MLRRSWIGTGIVAALAMACGGHQVHGNIGPGTTTTAAEQAGAANQPVAAVYLGYAHNELSIAKHEGASSDRGSRALQRASVDAELALAIAQRSEDRAEAIAYQRKIEQLKAEAGAKETL
jgi:hypothetical protein